MKIGNGDLSSFILVGIIFSLFFKGLSSENLVSICRCYTFTERKNHGTSIGVFKSPNHSNAYPSNLPCILYIFKAIPGKIVKIAFQTFQLRPKQHGRCVDYIDIYQNLESINSVSSTNYDSRHCKNLTHQTDFFSKHNILIIRFHSSTLLQSIFYQGFRGTYQFINKDYFQNSGHRIPGTSCSRRFQRNTSSSLKEPVRGRFFSPNYPQNYYANTRCQYIFSGKNMDRIILTFRNIKLDHDSKNCGSQNACDFIMVSETDQTSNSVSQPVLALVHGTYNYIQIVSHGPSVTVSFISNSDNMQGKGFEANYEFVDSYKVYPTSWINTSYDIQKITKVDKIKLPKIEEKEFYSKNSQSGFIASPNFPNVYPNDVEVYYIFYGYANQQIEIKFTKFNLGIAQDCDDYYGDRIELYDGEFSKVAVNTKTPSMIFCGGWGFFYLSQSNYLTMRFISDSVRGTHELGFYCKYRFTTITTTMAAIITTTRSPIVKTSENSCTFIIHGNGTHKRGQITSYMNKYSNHMKPRVCRWILKGTQTQRIVLKLWNSDVQSDSFNGKRYFNNCRFARDLKILNYRTEHLQNTAIDSTGDEVFTDVTQFCITDRVYSVMSSNVPRMDVIIQTAGSTAPNKDPDSTSSLLNSIGEALHLEYAFVEDFGVLSTGLQRNASCYFQFQLNGKGGRSQSEGNFSSPNYPGYIPSNIACLYVFRAPSYLYHIQIIISETQQPYRFQQQYQHRQQKASCSEYQGNVLRLDSCSVHSVEIPQILCRPNYLQNVFPIMWKDDCLRISLISKGSQMFRGFMGHYKFIKTDNPGKGSARISTDLFVLTLINLFAIKHLIDRYNVMNIDL